MSALLNGQPMIFSEVLFECLVPVRPSPSVDRCVCELWSSLKIKAVFMFILPFSFAGPFCLSLNMLAASLPTEII